jgi:hypothetical protein
MGRLGLAVIRHGAPVEGIQSGAASRPAKPVTAACIPLWQDSAGPAYVILFGCIMQHELCTAHLLLVQSVLILLINK